MKEATVKSAKQFVSDAALLLDTLQLRIAELMANEDENEDEITETQDIHDNLEIAVSRTNDSISQLEKQDA